MFGNKYFILFIFTIVTVGDKRCQGASALGQIYRTQQRLRCNLGKTLASLLRSEKLMSCAEDSDCSYTDRINEVWRVMLDSTMDKLSFYTHSTNGLLDGLIDGSLSKLLSEFLLGSVVFCTIIFAIYSKFWRAMHSFYDGVSANNTVNQQDSPLNETSGLVDCSITEVNCNTVCKQIEFESDDEEFFEMGGSPCSITSSSAHELLNTEGRVINEDADVLVLPMSEETGKLGMNNCDTVDLQNDQFKTDQQMDHTEPSNYVSCDSVSRSQDFIPVRPAPPTVKVFSLHKPHEIPNEVMDSLLCLEKDCGHDHSTIRLIGEKVIVYSSAQYKSLEERCRKIRGDQRMATSRAFGLHAFSDDWDDLTCTVATQTDTITTPSTLFFRTEAFMRGEGNGHYSEFPKGNMTGTLLIAKDSFETKIIRGSWSEIRSDRSSSASLPNMSFPNVRENIAKSRIEIAEFEGHLDGLNFEHGDFRHGDRLSQPHPSSSAPNPLDDVIERTGTPLKNSIATSRLNTTHCIKHRRPTSVIEPNNCGSTDCVAQKPTPYPYGPKSGKPSLVELSKNISSMGSETSFYEKLSLLVAGYAYHRYSQVHNRSVPVPHESKYSPQKMRRTL